MRRKVTTGLAILVACVGSLWSQGAVGVSIETSLNNCQEGIRQETTHFINRRLQVVGMCLQKISMEIIQKNSPDAMDAVALCVSQLGLLGDLKEKLVGGIDKRCEPGAHTLDDIIGTKLFPVVAEPLNAMNLDAYCANFGGDGSIDSLTEWSDCIVSASECAVDMATAVQFPRALEWLALVRPDMLAIGANDAVEALDMIFAAIDGVPADDLMPDIQCGPPGTRLLATGQTMPRQVNKNDGLPRVDVPDDGTLQLGLPLRYVDNGDGTITDLNTGLMWEKKCSTCPSTDLHHVDQTFPWDGSGSQDTIWDWLDDINTEGGTGYAGYSDWRIPNIRELLSIVDYEPRDPAINPIFGPTAFGGGFTGYLSSTATPGSADRYFVDFALGISGLRVVENHVRAVRGGK